MKRKPFFTIYYYLIFFLVISLLNHCSPAKKKNIIGIHYKKTIQYNETEIFQDLSKIAFKYNYQMIREGYEREPVYRVIKRFCRQGARIIILEDYSSDDLSKIIKYARKNEVLLSLITDKKIHDAPLVNLTEFKQLGYRIINDLYIFTRSKRNVFAVMYNADYINNFRKKGLLQGYSRFIDEYRSLTLLTNIYTDTNQAEFRKRIYMLTSKFSNNLRGILMDNDTVASKMAHILRRIGKENEIKVAGFEATLSGIDSMMKTGLVVSGDINRYVLFHNAFTNSILNYTEIMRNNKRITNISPGISYNQHNVFDSLSLTRKYSIKQIFKK